LNDDIQFISSGGAAANAGFFQNVGKSRRQGLELAATRKWGAFGLAARYNYIDASYQSSFAENSPVNTSADASGTIRVQSGNRIPGIPRHGFRLRLDYDVTAQWEVGANLLYAGGVFARGDENNSDTRGKVTGYTLLNLDTRYAMRKGWEVFARVNNVLDRQYSNFGLLGLNAFTGPNHTFDGAHAAGEQFRGYGAPRGIWIGTRYSWM
jgi:iron complex outermembrane receptor protein